jgi:hypothetical protein
MIFLALALALPPVTQAEGVLFHQKTLCGPSGQAGKGLNRRDGKGWIISPIPGKHIIDTGDMTYVLDMTPGVAYSIVAPGGKVQWCPKFSTVMRNACGPVPPSLLWDAVLATDPK